MVFSNFIHAVNSEISSHFYRSAFLGNREPLLIKMWSCSATFEGSIYWIAPTAKAQRALNKGGWKGYKSKNLVSWLGDPVSL